MRSHYQKYLLAALFALFASFSFAQSKIDDKQLLKDLKKLSHNAMMGRKTDTEGAKLARNYIIGQFESLHLKKFKRGYKHPFEFKKGKSIKGVNVVGYIKSNDKRSSTFVITAHYDHLGKIKGEIYNGADDNASGTAALLAIADYFKANPPSHNIIFVATDAEEMGLQGAKAFVKDPDVPMDNVVLNINMDMVSINNKNELYAAGTHHYPKLKPILEKVPKRTMRLRYGHDQPGTGHDDWTNSSDHSAFHQAGIPFIYFGVEDHEHYHKHTDEFENVNQTFYIKAVNLILDSIIAFDRALN